MTEEQVKIYLSKHVLPQHDKGNEAILRNIIFTLAENIDWEEAKELIYKHHPELKNQKYFDSLDLTVK